MYVWLPDSQEEIAFVEEKIIRNLTKLLFAEKGYSHNVWVGIVDKPNGNCLLQDLITKCPVTNYLDGEPNDWKGRVQECVCYKQTRFLGRAWDDVLCTKEFHALCEGEYESR